MMCALVVAFVAHVYVSVAPGGRLVVISFHPVSAAMSQRRAVPSCIHSPSDSQLSVGASRRYAVLILHTHCFQGEDRIVKRTFKSFVAATKEAEDLAERNRRQRRHQPQVEEQSTESTRAAVSVSTVSSAAPRGYHFEIPPEWKRPVLPTLEEVAANSRSRSAKLRVLQRCCANQAGLRTAS